MLPAAQSRLMTLFCRSFLAWVENPNPAELRRSSRQRPPCPGAARGSLQSALCNSAEHSADGHGHRLLPHRAGAGARLDSAHSSRQPRSGGRAGSIKDPWTSARWALAALGDVGERPGVSVAPNRGYPNRVGAPRHPRAADSARRTPRPARSQATYGGCRPPRVPRAAAPPSSRE
jgi:hypothetical protein